MANSSYLDSKLCAYPEKGKSAALPAPMAGQLGLFNARLVNNSGVSADLGIGALQDAGVMEYLSLESQTSSTGTYVQLPFPTSASPQQLFSGSADGGFVVGSVKPLNLIGVTVSTLNSGGTFVIEQWNGSAWVLAGDILEQPADYNTTGDKYHVMNLNTGLAKGGDAALLTAAPNTSHKYYTRIYSSGALGGAVLADDLWAIHFLNLRREIRDNGQMSVQFDWRQLFLLNAGEGLAPYFSVPNAANQVGAYFTSAG